MADTPEPSRGSQLLAEWRGELQQTQAAKLLDLDLPTYNRFEHGVRKPTGKIGIKIERLTDGKVPASAWYDPPAKAKTSEARAS